MRRPSTSPVFVTPAQRATLIDGVSTLIALETQSAVRGMRASRAVRQRVLELSLARRALYDVLAAPQMASAA